MKKRISSPLDGNRFFIIMKYIVLPIVLVIILVGFIPLIEPEFTIQCVFEPSDSIVATENAITAPCEVPNLTIFEWITQKFSTP